MKKVFRNLFAAIAAVSLVSSFASCSDGSGGDDENTSKTTEGIAVTGNEITFNVTADSTNKDDTVLFVKYDRSAKGAKELITIADAEFKISVNGTVTNTVKKITFELDEYGASFSRAATPIADKDDMKEYKTKIPVGVQVKKSDVVKVQLVKGTITGEGKNAVDLSAIVVALIDKAEKVSYYKELCENSSEYQALVKIEKTEEQLKAEAAKKAEEDAKKAEEAKKAAEDKAAADKKAADEKAAADKKAAEEKAAAEKAKTENCTSTSTTTENNNSGTTNTENENTGAGETPAATVVKTMAVNVNRYSDSEGAPETDHGIQYTEDMTAIPVDAKSGDVWTLKIAGTASDEFRGDMQFVDASWGGITGQSISKTFTKEAFDYEIDFTFSKDCSNGKFMLGNAGMDPAVAKTLSLTKYSFTKKSGAAATTPTETPAATDNVVWTGSAELAWSKGDDNGACINKEKFADKAFVGLKFTISAYENETAIKIMSQSNWKDIPFDSAESDCKVADSGNDLGKMLWIWGNTAIVKFSADTLVDIKGNGIKFYGTGVTITKVELVTN